MNRLDEIDQRIVTKREIRFNNRKGPRVGDFIRRLNGKLERFSHVWDDGIQTCAGGSFYLTDKGYVSMSGSLFPTVLNENIAETDEKWEGDFWIFHNDVAIAHNGVHFNMLCRVFKEIE